MYAGCWNFKTLKVSVAKLAILNSIRRRPAANEACEALAKYDQIA